MHFAAKINYSAEKLMATILLTGAVLFSWGCTMEKSYESRSFIRNDVKYTIPKNDVINWYFSDSNENLFIVAVKREDEIFWLTLSDMNHRENTRYPNIPVIGSISGGHARPQDVTIEQRDGQKIVCYLTSLKGSDDAACGAVLDDGHNNLWNVMFKKKDVAGFAEIMHQARARLETYKKGG